MSGMQFPVELVKYFQLANILYSLNVLRGDVFEVEQCYQIYIFCRFAINPKMYYIVWQSKLDDHQNLKISKNVSLD